MFRLSRFQGFAHRGFNTLLLDRASGDVQQFGAGVGLLVRHRPDALENRHVQKAHHGGGRPPLPLPLLLLCCPLPPPAARKRLLSRNPLSLFVVSRSTRLPRLLGLRKESRNKTRRGKTRRREMENQARPMQTAGERADREGRQGRQGETESWAL